MLSEQRLCAYGVGGRDDVQHVDLQAGSGWSAAWGGKSVELHDLEILTANSRLGGTE